MNRLTVFLVAFLFSTIHLQAQKERMLTDIEIGIYCPNFDKSKLAVNSFIQDYNVALDYSSESEGEMKVIFFMPTNLEKEFNAMVEELGFLYRRKTNTTSYTEKIKSVKSEIGYLENKIKDYEKELSEMDEKDERYYRYWEEIRKTKKVIFELNNELESYRDESVFKINLQLYEDNVDLTGGGINWVNMPGASFDMLMTETPRTDLSAEMYMGYSLKYMITRGKTHFTMGALKAFPKESDVNEMQFTELFHFGFGQDFYTKHFGRGKRKWFNLYTGYNLGGMFATAEADKDILPYANAYLGVELFKNRYFLIDNKVGYTVPFKYNRNLRGWMYHFSFNFVF